MDNCLLKLWSHRDKNHKTPPIHLQQQKTIKMVKTNLNSTASTSISQHPNYDHIPASLADEAEQWKSSKFPDFWYQFWIQPFYLLYISINYVQKAQCESEVTATTQIFFYHCYTSQQLLENIDNLENRSCWNNVRFIGIPAAIRGKNW